MTLIDHFKSFSEASAVNRVPANARSLYFAILSEFNKAGYPESLKLENEYLKHLSGISASSSFTAARSILQNMKIIRHKKSVYEMTPVGKTVAESWQNDGKIVAESKSSISIEQTKETETKTKTTTATASRAGELLSTNSAAVREMWFRCESEELHGNMAMELLQLENLYGTEKIVEAIREASRANRYGRLNYNFFIKVLQDRLNKGVSTNGRVEGNTAGSYGEVDEYPDGEGNDS